MDIFTRKQAKIHKSLLISHLLFLPKKPYVRQEKFKKLEKFSIQLLENSHNIGNFQIIGRELIKVIKMRINCICPYFIPKYRWRLGYI